MRGKEISPRDFIPGQEVEAKVDGRWRLATFVEPVPGGANKSETNVRVEFSTKKGLRSQDLTPRNIRFPEIRD